MFEFKRVTTLLNGFSKAVDQDLEDAEREIDEVMRTANQVIRVEKVGNKTVRKWTKNGKRYTLTEEPIR